MASIIAIGLALVDIYPEQGKMYPGGNEYNISCYAQELGAHSSFMGVFAPDRAGRLIEAELTRRGVDTSHSRHAEGYCNYALVELRANERVFTDWSHTGVTDTHPIRFTQEDFAYIRRHDVACAGYASRLREEDIRQLHHAGIPLAYDFSDTFSPDTLRRICPWVGFGFFSCGHLDENQCISLIKDAVRLGCGIAIATRGKLGSMAWDGDTLCTQPALDVPVVDTMGAGDAFIASFLFQWCSTKASRLPSAMRAAAAFSATIIQREGALGVGFDIRGLSLDEILAIKKGSKCMTPNRKEEEHK